jgi:hypothetical protein
LALVVPDLIGPALSLGRFSHSRSKLSHSRCGVRSETRNNPVLPDLRLSRGSLGDIIRPLLDARSAYPYDYELGPFQGARRRCGLRRRGRSRRAWGFRKRSRVPLLAPAADRKACGRCKCPANIQGRWRVHPHLHEYRERVTLFFRWLRRWISTPCRAESGRVVGPSV